jgi:phosphoribosylaminoimidazole (AIR) synthetase
MRKVFNLGIGVALIAHDHHRDQLLEVAQREGFQLLVIGTVE